VLDEFKKVSGRNASNDLIFYSERDGEVGEVDLSTAFKTFLKNIEHEGRAEGLRTSSEVKHGRSIRFVTSMRSSD